MLSVLILDARGYPTVLIIWYNNWYTRGAQI